MPPSFFSDLKEVFDEAVESVEEFGEGIVEGVEEFLGVAPASTSQPNNPAAQATSELTLAASIEPSRPTPPSSLPFLASPTSTFATPTSTFIEFTSSASLTSTAITSATPTLAPSPGGRGVDGNVLALFLCFLGGIAAVCLIQLLTPVIIRSFQFAVNVGRICFVSNRLSSFNKDSELGLSSETFSLTQNIEGNDQRSGLDKKAKIRILWYMFFYGESFDEARFRYTIWKFAQNGIGPDGQPLDPKFVRQGGLDETRSEHSSEE